MKKRSSIRGRLDRVFRPSLIDASTKRLPLHRQDPGCSAPKQLCPPAPALFPYALAVLVLFIGGLVYVLCRSSSIRFFVYVQNWDIWPFLVAIRSKVAPVCSYCPEALLYSFPDGAFSFAYAAIMTQLWWGHPGVLSGLWLLSIPVVGVGLELSQMLPWMPGTFTGFDLIFCVLGTGLGVWIHSWSRFFRSYIQR
jgi:hypothetical protein